MLPVAIARPLSTLSFSTILEDRISFQFFTENIVPGLRLISPSHEWITLSLQLSSTEPCIYLAIAACASVASARLSRRYHCFFAPPSPIKDKRNLRQYGKATAALQKYIKLVACGKGTLEPILLCCLVLVAYETFQNECGLAVQHLQFGKRVVKEGNAGHWQFSSRSVAKDVTTAFDWYGEQMCDFQKDSVIRLEGRKSHLTQSLAQPSIFVSIEVAKQALDCLASAASSWRSDLLTLAAQHVAKFNRENQRPAVLECIIHYASRSLPLSPVCSLLRRQTQLLQAHRTWQLQLSALQQDQDCTNRRALLHMQIQLFYSYFILATARDTHAKQMDRLDDQATVILDLVEEYLFPSRAKLGPRLSCTSGPALYPYTPLPQKQEYSFSLEYVVIPTLFAICMKLQHFGIRRRALRLLRSANRREAGQSSEELCHYAEAMIHLEESVAGVNGSDSVRSLEIVIEEAGYLEVSLVCGRFRTEGDGLLEIAEYKGGGLPPLRLQKIKESVLPFGINAEEHIDESNGLRRSRKPEDRHYLDTQCFSEAAPSLALASFGPLTSSTAA